MTSLSNLFLTKGNERNRDKFCIALFEKAWLQAEREKRIPGAEDVNQHLVHILQDAIKFEDFRNVARLRDAIANWQFLSGLQVNQRRQLEIMQLVLLTEILDNQYQELLQTVRVRELTHCCDEFIQKREKQLSGRFTAPLATINPEQITNSDLNLKVRQYLAVLNMQSTLNTENTNDIQKVAFFSRNFTACRSILETDSNSLGMQFIRKVLGLLPNTLISYFSFFRTETQLLTKNIDNLAGDIEDTSYNLH